MLCHQERGTMCGIFCYICHSNSKTENETQWHLFEENIRRRGPDCSAKQNHQLNHQWRAEMVGSVLWMQGSRPVEQPCIDENKNILLFNGDIFDGPLADPEGESDTLILSKNLSLSNDILATISSIKGPFSLVYFHRASNCLYFGRDSIGRHSLLININHEDQSVTITSVANKNAHGIVELPAVGIFVIDLNKSTINLTCHPWQKLDDYRQASFNKLAAHFGREIRLNQAQILPSTCKLESQQCKPNELCDFESCQREKSVLKTMESFLLNEKIQQRVERLLNLLKNSIKIRINRKPDYCKNCIKQVINSGHESVKCSHSKLGILFSGGLDSTLIARIADEFVPETDSIDLLNVAFEKIGNKNSNVKKNNEKSINFDVPDRQTGRQALRELKVTCPTRIWNFVEINVSRNELENYSLRIADLIYPLRTVLDESLGCAVWFSSRGSGVLSSINEAYVSPVRVLLLGMGADELFGGYTRHRNTLRRSGWMALAEELNTELSRISERNLGRDDRAVSDHGRQSRLPYLDEDLVNFVENLNPWERCYPTENMPPGLGDKLLLRLLAYKLGLRETSAFPKRAFQFGSRIANSRQNANDPSTWL